MSSNTKKSGGGGGNAGMSPELEQIMRRQRQRSSGGGREVESPAPGGGGSAGRGGMLPPTTPSAAAGSAAAGGAPPPAASPGRSASAYRRSPYRSDGGGGGGAGDAHRMRRRSRSRSATRGGGSDGIGGSGGSGSVPPPSPRTARRFASRGRASVGRGASGSGADGGALSVDTSSGGGGGGGGGGGSGNADREMEAYYTPTAATPRGFGSGGGSGGTPGSGTAHYRSASPSAGGRSRRDPSPVRSFVPPQPPPPGSGHGGMRDSVRNSLMERRRRNSLSPRVGVGADGTAAAATPPPPSATATATATAALPPARSSPGEDVAVAAASSSSVVPEGAQPRSPRSPDDVPRPVSVGLDDVIQPVESLDLGDDGTGANHHTCTGSPGPGALSKQQRSKGMDASEQAVSGYTTSSRSHSHSHDDDGSPIDRNSGDYHGGDIAGAEEDLPMDEREDSMRSSPSKSPQKKHGGTAQPGQAGQSGEASGWAWNTGASAGTSTESWQNFGSSANAETAPTAAAASAVAGPGPGPGGDATPTDWFSPAGSAPAGFFDSNDFFGESKFAEANDQAQSEQHTDDGDDDGFGARATEPRPSTPPISNEILDSNPDIAALRESKPVIDFQPRLLRTAGAPSSSLDGPSILGDSAIPPPTVNPLSGNLIALKCKSSGSFELQEMDLTTSKCRTALSTPILTVDMRRRIHSQYGKSPVSVAGVSSIAAGVHRQQGRARVRVSAIIDFVCVEVTKLGTNKPTADASDNILRVVVVWSWGYATFLGRPVALQSVIVPPTPSQDHYDDATLCVADGLLFLGSKKSPPTIFVAKPTVRDGWSDHKVGLSGSDASISALAATTHPGRGNKYLAVGKTDGSASVWSYDLAATTNKIATSQSTASSPRLLVPVCRLDGSSALKATGKATLLIGKRFGSRARGGDVSAACTSLEWLPPGPAASTPLMLAAAYPDGVAVFHISIPLVMDLKQLPSDSVSELSTASLDDPPSSVKGSSRGGGGTPTLRKSGLTTNSTLDQAVLIAPLSAARTNIDHRIQRAVVSWLNLGPRCMPALSLLFEHLTSSDKRERVLVVGAIDLAPFGQSQVDEAKGTPRPIVVLCERSASTRINNQIIKSAATIVGLNTTGSVIGSSGDGAIFAFSPHLSRRRKTKNKVTESESTEVIDDRYFVSLSHPVSSEALGLNSGGFISTETEDVLHVFSVYQRKRESLRELPLSAGGRLSDTLGMTELVLRHWLCRSVVGDKKSAKKSQTKSSSINDGFPSGGGDEVSTSGAETSVITELTCASEDGTNLIPSRIVRSPSGKSVVVLFTQAFSSTGRVSVGSSGRGLEVVSHPVAYAMIDSDAKSQGLNSFELRRGIDVAFLSDDRILVLCEDQRSIQERSLSDDGIWSDGEALPLPFAGTDDADSMVARRVYVSRALGTPRLLFVASRVADGRTCLALCDGLARDEMDSYPSTADLILMSGGTKNPRFWLERQEHLLSLVTLPNHQEEQKPCIAIATQSCVMMLSSSLRFMAGTHVKMPASSLVPLGSHCVAFCSSSSTCGGGDAKIRYLSCIKNDALSPGIIATLPRTKFGFAPHLLMAIRPDRLAYISCHCGTRMVEHGENMNSFLAPIPTTRPAFLLEPLIASALSQGGGVGSDISDNETIQLLLRTLLERFGRKTSSFPHSENEGTGILGTGITQKVYELLDVFSCRQAASFLLTGDATNVGASSTKGEILPPWLPVTVKARAAGSSDDILRVLSSGDQYLAEYLSSPGTAMATNLPPTSAAPTKLAMQMAVNALKDTDGNNISRAMKLLDFAGGERCEEMLIQIALVRQRSPNSNPSKLLKQMSGGKTTGSDGSKESRRQLAALAALSTSSSSKSSGRGISADNKFWSKQVAPSLQKGRSEMRERNQLLGHDAISAVSGSDEATKKAEHPWDFRLDERKNVWSKGPFNQREEILLLDKFEEWLGRRRPTVLGKEGAEMAAESGEKTLADLLSAAAYDREDEKSTGDGAPGSALADGWVEGVGEGRSDEDNLALYLRFSEGAEEDCNYLSEGFEDLSKYDHRAFVCGSDSLILEATSSSADEGEAGKVKLLYDLVFSELSGYADARGLFVAVDRGSSLDVGMLHDDDNGSRQRCTIEMWYRLPQASEVSDEIILARRSLASEDDDLSRLCAASEREGLLWELAVLPSGRLQFRASGGGTLTSEIAKDAAGLSSINEAEEDDGGLVSWQREDGLGGWNHVCLSFSSKGQHHINNCQVSLLMKGALVTSKLITIVPPSLDAKKEALDAKILDEVLARSALMFGLAAPAGFRLTEIRAWSCERGEDDVKLMMTEYLRAAETRKKFKVKIRSTKGASKKLGFLAPPKESDQSDPRKILLSPINASRKDGGVDEDGTPKSPGDAMPKQAISFDAFNAFDDASAINDVAGSRDEDAAGADVAAAFSDSVFGSNAFQTETDHSSPAADDGFAFGDEATAANPGAKSPHSADADADADADDVPMAGYMATTYATRSTYSFAVDLSPSLSQQVRASAAAALVRGPPATRHFGGNRGGIVRTYPDFLKTSGVGSIAICGAEKSVVYDVDGNPPGKTFPIGSSGAIISDILDEDGSEYLCCFLAKEKRMVVFELTSKTVVVELQMTTKLNYWRFLPPEVHGNTLVYMLITPVGGFHWSPLDESPRPRQVWKRGPGLQSKKIVSYEEGGCNGGAGSDMRSTLALLMVSTANSGAPVEAWCLPVNGDSRGLLLGDDVLGAALCLPPAVARERSGNGGGDRPAEFYPLVITANKINGSDDVYLDVTSIGIDSTSGVLSKLDTVASVVVACGGDSEQEHPVLEPTMAMGTTPQVYLCSHGKYIVAGLRSKGIVLVYELHDGSLKLVGQENLGQYIVDAGVRPGGDINKEEEDIEIVLLLCSDSTAKDGNIAKILVTSSYI